MIVEREFKGRGRLGIASLPFFLLLLTTCIPTPDAWSQWQKVKDLGSINSPAVVTFNAWGIGFAGGISTSVPENFDAMGGVWRSVDSGLTWLLCDVTHDPAFAQWFYHPVCVQDICFADSLIGWMTCFTNPVESYQGGAIYRTTDGGVSWQSCFFHAGARPRAVHFDSARRSVMVSMGYSTAILESLDLGDTWREATTIPYYLTTVNGFAAVDSLIFVSTVILSSSPWLRSTNHGKSWELYPQTGNSSFVESWQPCYADGCFFALLDGGAWNSGPFPLYRSDDRGGTWRVVHIFPRSINWTGPTGSVVTDGNGKIFVQDMTRGMLASSDSGTSWVDLCGPSDWLDTRFGAIGPFILAADYAGGIWRLDTRRTAGVSLPDSIAVQRTGCQAFIRSIPLTAWSVCGNGVMLDSVSVAGSTGVVVVPEVLPRPLLGSDSVRVQVSSSDKTDTTSVTLHLTLMGKRLDTTIIVTAIGDANATAEVELSNTMGNPTIVTAEGKDDVVAVRMAGNVSQTYRLDALHCSVSLPRDLTTKSGPCIGVNGWRVTNETLNGTDLTLDVSRQSPVDLHAGDEIVRIPIRANVALDTVGYVVLKDYSFNADFKGCTPESITPDTVKIVVTPECGDSTIRHFMRTNSIFELLTIEPNPARNEVTVEVRGPGSGVRDPGVKMEIVDVLGNVRLSGTVDPPKTTIDVSSLAAGTYFLRLSEGGEVRTRRFVIAR